MAELKQAFGGDGIHKYYSYHLHFCKNCGWWRCTEEKGDYDDYTYDDWYTEKATILESVAKQFDITTTNLPIALLKKYLASKFNDIREIHPRKFEEIVASIFGEHFSCEVRLTAQSWDGGYDLYAVISDEPHLIEVKRRSKPCSTESVRTVRELLGVMLLNDVPNGIIVSTADHFSKMAFDEAKKITQSKAPYRIELMNYNDLHELFLKSFDFFKEIESWIKPFWGRRNLLPNGDLMLSNKGP